MIVKIALISAIMHTNIKFWDMSVLTLLVCWNIQWSKCSNRAVLYIHRFACEIFHYYLQYIHIVIEGHYRLLHIISRVTMNEGYVLTDGQRDFETLCNIDCTQIQFASLYLVGVRLFLEIFFHVDFFHIMGAFFSMWWAFFLLVGATGRGLYLHVGAFVILREEWGGGGVGVVVSGGGGGGLELSFFKHFFGRVWYHTYFFNEVTSLIENA